MTGRSRARDRSRPSGAAPAWTPARLSNLAAWFRADLGVTGSSVSAWADQSGNGRHLTQGTGANQPTFTASSAPYGGREVFTFDGGDWLNIASTWTLAQPDTIYVVGDTIGSNYETFVDATGAQRQLIRGTPTNTTSFFAGSAALDASVDPRSPSIMCAVFNGGSSALYVNSTTAGATGNPGTQSLVDLRIGAAPGALYPLSSGARLAEVILYSAAHDATARALVLSYLARRYNLSVTGL